MAEPKNGRPIFFPENLVLLGNLALFVWIVLDAVAFLLYDITVGIIFFVVALIAIYGVLHFIGCLRPCYNCIKCTHGMGRLAALYFANVFLKTKNIATNCQQQYSSPCLSVLSLRHSHYFLPFKVLVLLRPRFLWHF
jgi:hypothetical protein